jgi:PadR family transcriptional regulator, regulatory protein PadR
MNEKVGDMETGRTVEPRLVLGEFEELVLLAILGLSSDEAYGVSIHRAVEEIGLRPATLGAVYVTLDRLEQKGYVTSRMSESVRSRGGRSKRIYEVTGLGQEAVADAEMTRARLRKLLRPSAAGL